MLPASVQEPIARAHPETRALDPLEKWGPVNPTQPVAPVYRSLKSFSQMSASTNANTVLTAARAMGRKLYRAPFGTTGRIRELRLTAYPCFRNRRTNEDPITQNDRARMTKSRYAGPPKYPFGIFSSGISIPCRRQ